MPKPDYDTTLARIAGNIAAGFVVRSTDAVKISQESVKLARAIVAEVKRTEPVQTVTLCTCHVVTGGHRALNPNCPIHGDHGNIQQKCDSSPAQNRLETEG